jgi:hypothetical protein
VIVVMYGGVVLVSRMRLMDTTVVTAGPLGNEEGIYRNDQVQSSPVRVDQLAWAFFFSVLGLGPLVRSFAG